MGLSLKPEHLTRYKDIGLLLIRHGRSDLVEQSGIAGALSEREFDEERRRELQGDAAELADDLERMGPIYVKLGQLLSTRVDLLPEPYVRGLARLQDRVDPFPTEEADRIIQEELGVRLSTGFARFQETPIASASLGQVYRATLRDGREVVVKVQRPQVREQVADDLSALGELARFLDDHTETGRRYRFSLILDEFARNLARELDYLSEARNLRLLGQNLREFPRLIVPQPIDDFTTGRVLTMEFVAGRKVTSVGPLTRLEMQGGALAETLFRAYLKQILVDGFFHADPHPGNVFITDDRSLALIDLGMIGHVPPALQGDLLQLLVAIAAGRSDEAAQITIDIGNRREHFDEEEYRRRAAALVTQQQNATVGEIEIGRVVMEVARAAADTGLDLPTTFTMLGKTLLNLDEVARSLDPQFDPNGSIRRNVADITQRRIAKEAMSGNALTAALESREFLQELPGRLNRVLERLAANEFELQVEAIDEKTLIDGFQKVANRITVGLVIAALIVGAAMLMRVETDFRIFGYPGLAMLCFLAAAGFGFWLIVSVMLTDRREREG